LRHERWCVAEQTMKCSYFHYTEVLRTKNIWQHTFFLLFTATAPHDSIQRQIHEFIGWNLERIGCLAITKWWISTYRVMGQAVGRRPPTSDDLARPVQVGFVVDTVAVGQVLRTAMQKQIRTYFWSNIIYFYLYQSWPSLRCGMKQCENRVCDHIK
jgi:hypothetical protein